MKYLKYFKLFESINFQNKFQKIFSGVEGMTYEKTNIWVRYDVEDQKPILAFNSKYKYEPKVPVEIEDMLVELVDDRLLESEVGSIIKMYYYNPEYEQPGITSNISRWTNEPTNYNPYKAPTYRAPVFKILEEEPKIIFRASFNFDDSLDRLATFFSDIENPDTQKFKSFFDKARLKSERGYLKDVEILDIFLCSHHSYTDDLSTASGYEIRTLGIRAYKLFGYGDVKMCIEFTYDKGMSEIIKKLNAEFNNPFIGIINLKDIWGEMACPDEIVNFLAKFGKPQVMTGVSALQEWEKALRVTSEFPSTRVCLVVERGYKNILNIFSFEINVPFDDGTSKDLMVNVSLFPDNQDLQPGDVPNEYLFVGGNIHCQLMVRFEVDIEKKIDAKFRDIVIDKFETELGKEFPSVKLSINPNKSYDTFSKTIAWLPGIILDFGIKLN